MSSADINKVLLAIFSALLTVLLIQNVINVIVHSEPHPNEAHGVAMAVAGEQMASTAQQPAAAAAPKPAALEPVGPLLASADPAAGQKDTKRCATCHTFTQGGPNKVGPNLWGVVGRKKGSEPGFDYSAGMSAKGGTWTYEDLNHFLANPREFVSGTKMTFAGFKDVKDRANVIAYLRQLAATPVPLPEK